MASVCRTVVPKQTVWEIDKPTAARLDKGLYHVYMDMYNKLHELLSDLYIRIDQ